MSDARYRAVVAAEFALVFTAVWLVGPRVAAMRLAQTAGQSLGVVLVFWLGTLVIELAAFYAISWDDFGDLMVASLRGSAPAMWFAPAILLLGLPSRAATAIGVVLVANTVRMLVSAKAPRRLGPAPDVRRRSYRLFGERVAPDTPFSSEFLWMGLGALAFESAVYGIWSEHPYIPAALAACGAMLWTLTSIARGTMERRDPTRRSHWLLGILLNLLLTSGLSFAAIEWQAAPEPEVFKPNVTHLATPPSKMPTREIDAAGGVSLVPGVILRPGEMPRQGLTFGPGRAADASGDTDTAFPFTGEYHLFPLSSANVKHAWAMDSGTLLEHMYQTAGGSALETEAYQPLVPPADFSRCGQIEMELVHAEDGPFGAFMSLDAGGGRIELGSEICGLDRRTRETVRFDVAAAARVRGVSAIRVAFHAMPRPGAQSVKVDIRQFTLQPAKGH